MRKFYRNTPDENGNETIEERAIRLEAELQAERDKVKNQNSYITKLESDKKALEKPVTPAAKVEPTNTVVQSTATKQLSAAERFAIETATKQAIQEQEVALKAKYGEEVYNEFKDDFVSISKANIHDPFEIPKDLFQRVEAMALGKAMTVEEKRVKIAGAYVKPNVVEAAPASTVVVSNPSDQKITTLNPSDKQQLGQQVPPTSNATKPMTRSEFLAQFSKNQVIKPGK